VSDFVQNTVDVATTWICPTCKAAVGTPFCARCGEEPIAAVDLTLRGLVAKIFNALTSIDARVMSTAWRLIRHPGEITLAWTDGARRRYVAPFQLFLLANVIFFALQSATGTDVFGSSLDSHLHHQDWSAPAQALLDEHLAAKGLSYETYAPAFDRAVVLNAKSLILLMTIPFAALLPLVFFREHRPLMLHVVFAVHVYTFLLLLFCVALLAAKASEWAGSGGLQAPMVDNVLSVFNLLACAIYLYAAIGLVYEARGWWRVAKAALLAVATGLVVLMYRFVLFLITLYGT
jgi:hypothetical protein